MNLSQKRFVILLKPAPKYDKIKQGETMKIKHVTYSIIFALLASILFATGFLCIKKVNAEVENLDSTVLEQTSSMLSADYLDFYAIPSSFFTYSNNGGSTSSSPLSNAFDRNFSTYFTSSQDNNVSYTDEETGETKENFINQIDVEFSTNVSINRILYATESQSTTRGYPTKLNIYANLGNGLELVKSFQTSETPNAVIFNLGKTISTNQIRFEYETVSTRHRYCATAREIIFLQEENTALYNDFCNIFEDYAELTLSQFANTQDKISSLEQKFASKINFESVLKNKFDRAKDVALGQISYSEKREFSTNPNVKNVVGQFGNIKNYSRNTLKFSWFGTNRQVTGIFAKPGEQITIYVEASENDPLPTICFSQNEGHWGNWLGSEITLVRGKNVVSAPSFVNSSYTKETVEGGTIYINNPYLSSEQSSNVKIYFEGGSVVPTFVKGQNETQYLEELESYVEKINENPNEVANMTEIVSNHVILTVSATKANEIYKTFSPQQTTQNWDEYLQQLLAFDGVSFDATSALYSNLNNHLNVNIRLAQPYAGAAAYAHIEHVGIYSSWEQGALYGSNLGWGFAHEIGHMLDISERVVGECSNNMISKFDETVLRQVGTRGEFEKTLNALSSDLVDTTTYFNSNRLNYLIWWYVEAYQNGFWGELENCYRGLNENYLKFIELSSDVQQKIKSLSATEKHVLFASIAFGQDLSYYFERWGFNLQTSEPVFAYDSSSENFKSLIQLAISNNIIGTKKLKLWYQDEKQYNFTSGGGTGIYSQSSPSQIKKVFKTQTGYNIILNSVSSSAHLGFEILEGNETDGFKVVGFTQTNSFMDTTSYPNSYTPTYKVIAYDRMFNCSAQSQSASPENILQSDVCKIGETFYSSIYEAIQNANANDEIVVLKSTNEFNLTISKNLTIKLNESSSQNIVISKVEHGNLLTVENGATLTLVGRENTKLVLSGNEFGQNGSLVEISGTLNAKHVKFTQSFSTSNGSAINILAGGNAQISNCVFENNKAKSATINLNAASAKATISNSTIQNNTATNASAILNIGTVKLENCVVSNNTSENDATISNASGGILRVNECTVENNSAKQGAAFLLDGFTQLENTAIKNNVSTQGCVNYSTSVAVRTVLIKNCTFENNQGFDVVVSSGVLEIDASAFSNGSSLYVQGGKTTVNSSCEFFGKIKIKNGATLVLKDGLFENFEKSCFVLESLKQTMIVFETQNFTLENLDSVVVESPSVSLSTNENTVVATLVQTAPPDQTPSAPQTPTQPETAGDSEGSIQGLSMNLIVIISTCGAIALSLVIIFVIYSKIKKSKRKNR